MIDEDLIEVKDIVKGLYKNDKGEPFELTDGQAGIFDLIYSKKHHRNHINTFTRYGKSEVVSMAVLTRVSTFPEKWAIVAGTADKARIIMANIIKHIFDNDYTRKRFVIDKGESEENIRRYKNKDRINFKLDNGLLGEVFITSAEGAMGFGASNVVEDEAALVSDNFHSYVMRMLGDQPENFLCKIGNPFDSKHFRASEKDPKYNHIKIDWRQGIAEGRLTEEYVEEMRHQANFGILYECEFPPEDVMDEHGWVQLLSKDDIDRAMVEPDSIQGFGITKSGADIAGGGKNFSVIVNRWTNMAQIVYKSNERDTMKIAEMVIDNMDAFNIDPRDTYGDIVGIGRGLCDIVRRVKPMFNGINFATTARDHPELYMNLRSQCYWKLREWILAGGKLVKNNAWYQLSNIYYRTKIDGTRGGKIQIMSKEEMLKRGIESPDECDALALTFVNPDVVRKEDNIEDKFFKAKMKAKNKTKDSGYNLKMC
jgi:hypothetical protein